MTTLLGLKSTTQASFDDQGRRWPVTAIQVAGCTVTGVKTQDKDGYWAVILGIGQKKARRGAKVKLAPLHFKEVRVNEDEARQFKVGEVIKPETLLKAGDVVKVTGWTKGKGFAGVVKRHHFKGGPRTHGQSDRERAPGSIGSTTTPGRVLKGKRMAGRMGNARRSVKNLLVVGWEKDHDILLVRGLLPGAQKGLLIIEAQA